MTGPPPEAHITYVRDSDRTRVVFVYQHPLKTARALADLRCPKGFRWCAETEHHDGPIHVPQDGDDYGASGVPVYESQVS